MGGIMIGTYIAIGVIAVVGLSIIGLYNGLISSRNNVKQSWSGIDVQLKRRSDLIPNLVNTVKGYAKHEKELLENVTKARTSVMKAAHSGDLKKAAASSDVLTSSLKSLFAVAENYPKLQANDNFKQLQIELSKTEDQIAAARRIYNENVASFNTKIEMFPNNVFAGMMHFKAFDMFKATAKEKENVKVEF
jgi:LemA protein